MQIDPLQLPGMILAILLGGLLVLSLIYDLKRSRKNKSKDETVYRCAACRKIYSVQGHTPLARCPYCGETNEPAHN